MLAMPAPTPYDLRFRLFDIPVRVHPMFWLVSALMGYNPYDPWDTALWVLCVFASILVHEFGHGLMGRAFGQRPEIALYGMGGLCSSDRERTPLQSLAVLFCGPGAGFVFYGLLLLASPSILRLVPPSRPDLWLRVEQALAHLEFINLSWGLVNLLPIYPMDGGQIAGVVLTQANRRSGMRWTHILSMVVGGAVAYYMYQRGQKYAAFLFAYFVFLNFQAMQALNQQSRYGVYQDDDWWRR